MLIVTMSECVIARLVHRSPSSCCLSVTMQPMRISWRVLAASVALEMVLASGSTWFAMHHSEGEPYGEAIIDSHMRTLVAPSPTDVSSSERRLVKPWFNGRIAQAIDANWRIRLVADNSWPEPYGDRSQ